MKAARLAGFLGAERLRQADPGGEADWQLLLDSRGGLDRPGAAATRGGERLRVSFPPRGKAVLRPEAVRLRRPLEEGGFGEPALDALLSAFHRLHPVEEVLIEEEGLQLVLERPLPWPAFVRLDLARPFSASAGAWGARLAGLGVARLRLAGGAMELALDEC